MNKSLWAPLILLVSIVIFIASCNKDEAAGNCRLTKFIYPVGSPAFYEVYYDGDRIDYLLYKLNNGTVVQTINYNYNGSGLLISKETVDSNDIVIYKTAFTYNGQNQVIQEDYFVRNSGVLERSSYWVFEYNPNGTLNNYVYWIDGIVPFINSSMYYLTYDANGNFTRSIYKDGLGITQDTTTYTYGSSIYPFYPVDYPEPRSYKNNILTETNIPTGGGSSETATYSYTFNSQGYPVSVYIDTEDEEYAFEYQCE